MWLRGGVPNDWVDGSIAGALEPRQRTPSGTRAFCTRAFANYPDLSLLLASSWRGSVTRPRKRIWPLARSRSRNTKGRSTLSLDSREAGCARLLCCPGSDDTMKALVTDGSVTLRTADLN